MSKFIHEILMNIRKENKYTRKALSFLSGFNENTILAYERNMRKPSKEYIKFMSLYFDVREDYINGISEDKKPLNDLYRVFEMYKEIYPQNASKVNEVFEKHGLEYNNMGNIAMASITKTYENLLYDFLEIIKELNIDFNSFYIFDFMDEQREEIELSMFKLFNIKATIDKDKLKLLRSEYEQIKKNYHNSKDKNAILINKEFYASVIKKRNQPKDIYIPLDENTKDFNPKYYEIEQIQNKINLKMQELQEDIKDKMKEIKQLQDDLMMKMSD